MVHPKLVGALVCALLGSLGTMAASAQPLAALSTVVSTPSGEPISISDLARGRVTVVTFWMTTCRSSKLELDDLLPLARELDGQVLFVAVAIDNAKTAARVAPLAASRGYRMVVLLDSSQELFRLVNGVEHPFTLVFDASGRLVARHSGYIHGDADVLRAELLALPR